MSFSHRSSLKKANKPFKGSSKSKSKIKGIQKTVKKVSKHDRKNSAKMILIKKNKEILSHKKLYSGSLGMPKVVALVPICPDVDAAECLKSLSDQLFCGMGLVNVNFNNQKIQFIPTKRNILEIMDAAKVANLVIFIVSANEQVDFFGERIMSLVKAQGISGTASIIQYVEGNQSGSSYSDIIKSIEFYMQHHFTDEHRVFSLERDNQKILQFITAHRLKTLHWRDRHSYIVAEHLEYLPQSSTLKISGIVRGASLSANRLIHIQNFGDFQIEKITSEYSGICDKDSRERMDLEPMVLQVPDQADSLESQNEPDPMEGEQIWPTDEEITIARSEIKRTRRVPKGTSSYQAAWIIDSDHEDDKEVVTHDSMNFDHDIEEGIQDSLSEQFCFSDEEYEQIELEDKSGAFDLTIDEEKEEKE